MLLRSGGKPPVGNGEAPALVTSLFRSGIAYGSMVIGLFVGWGLISRLGLVAFSMEGRNFWILKTAPVNAGMQLVAKFCMSYLPALILAWIYLLGVAALQHTPFSTILYGLLAIALILAGLGGINLALGVRSVNLSWTDPRKMENGMAGLVGTIVSILYQLITLILFFGPPLALPLLGVSGRDWDVGRPVCWRYGHANLHDTSSGSGERTCLSNRGGVNKDTVYHFTVYLKTNESPFIIP